MNHSEIKPLYESSNLYIVQLPTRNFPSIVLQGDTFYSFYKNIQGLKKNLDPNTTKELFEDIDELENRFKNILNVYEKVLAENNLKRPY